MGKLGTREKDFEIVKQENTPVRVRMSIVLFQLMVNEYVARARGHAKGNSVL
jgi:hypothetical protein